MPPGRPRSGWTLLGDFAEAGDALLSVQLVLANEGGDGDPAVETPPSMLWDVLPPDRALRERAGPAHAGHRRRGQGGRASPAHLRRCQGHADRKLG
jgi:hypothetical protein